MLSGPLCIAQPTQSISTPLRNKRVSPDESGVGNNSNSSGRFIAGILNEKNVINKKQANCYL